LISLAFRTFEAMYFDVTWEGVSRYSTIHPAVPGPEERQMRRILSAHLGERANSPEYQSGAG
jgi:hypothetical protein